MSSIESSKPTEHILHCCAASGLFTVSLPLKDLFGLMGAILFFAGELLLMSGLDLTSIRVIRKCAAGLPPTSDYEVRDCHRCKRESGTRRNLKAPLGWDFSVKPSKNPVCVCKLDLMSKFGATLFLTKNLRRLSSCLLCESPRALEHPENRLGCLSVGVHFDRINWKSFILCSSFASPHLPEKWF